MSATLDGGFVMTGSTNIGDPYQDPPRARVHESKGKRQFQTCNPKVGQTGDNWGEGKRGFMRLSNNQPYADPHKQDSGGRLANRAKNRTEFGFKYASPMKASSTIGDYAGCFQATSDHFSEGTYGVRGVKTKIEESLEKKNVMTSPMKIGSFGYVGTTLADGAAAKVAGFGNEYEYKADPYDATRDARKKDLESHYAAIGEKKAFKSMCHNVDMFDAVEHTAASKVYSWDDACKMRPPPPEESMTPKERVEARADGVLKEGYKPFSPSSYTKSSHQATFSVFPEYSHDLYSEKMLRRTMMPDRHAPVKEMMVKHGLSEAMLERKPFKPNSFARSRVTRGVCLLGINKHKL